MNFIEALIRNDRIIFILLIFFVMEMEKTSGIGVEMNE